MPVITVTGLIGSGVIEIGPRISERLGIDHVDRTILAEAAKKSALPSRTLPNARSARWDWATASRGS